MNILVINRWVGYNEGGNETQIKDLMTQFIKAGHKITVITTKGDALKVFDDQINSYYVNSPQKYFSYGLDGIYHAIMFDIKSFFVFLNLYLKGERFDIMSIHFSLEAFLARIIRLFFGIPYSIFLAGDTPLELIEAKRADGKIQISHFMNQQCQKYGYSAEVISKGIDLKKYNPQVDASLLRKKLGIGDKKVILTMCRLDPRKNLITLIEAVKILNEEKFLENIVIVIAGDGVEKEFLKQKTAEYDLNDKVIFAGSVPMTSEEHPMYYAMSSLFVLPTLYEGFGWVFLEAMASGLPIITTNGGSNPEVVGDIGSILPPKTPDLFAKEIKRVLTDNDLYSKMREAGLKKAQNYSWDIVAKRFNDYYENVSKNKSNTLDKKLKEIGYIFYDAFGIIISLFKDKVIFNKEVQNFNVTGQKGGTNGSI